jgi:hypothetical protein
MMDLCEYVYHVTMHKFDTRLWKFHLVHHSDLRVDVSTTVSEHPGETCIRTLFFNVMGVYLRPRYNRIIIKAGFPNLCKYYGAYRNFRLSHRANKISWAKYLSHPICIMYIITIYKLPYTDCNYGDVLSIWDRLCSALIAELDKEETISSGLTPIWRKIPMRGM